MPGQLLGYARVSTTDQDLTVQLEQLAEAGVDDRNIFAEKMSGKNIDRPELQRLLSYARDGDTIIVSRVDRFSRSVSDFCIMVDELSSRGIGFKCLTQPIDTTNAAGIMMAQILAVFAQFERTIRSERQKEGIAKAKAEGRYKAPSHRAIAIKKEMCRKLKRENPDMGAAEIARRVQCSRDTVYRACPGEFGPEPYHLNGT